MRRLGGVLRRGWEGVRLEGEPAFTRPGQVWIVEVPPATDRIDRTQVRLVNPCGVLGTEDLRVADENISAARGEHPPAEPEQEDLISRPVIVDDKARALRTLNVRPKPNAPRRVVPTGRR